MQFRLNSLSPAKMCVCVCDETVNIFKILSNYLDPISSSEFSLYSQEA